MTISQIKSKAFLALLSKFFTEVVVVDKDWFDVPDNPNWN